MEKSRRWAIPHLIAVLGLVAVATSIAAEITRTKRDEVSYDYGGGCTLPQSPALPLGIAAAISLFLAQITANIMGGCVCLCCSKKNRGILSAPLRLIAITFLILSWTSFMLALLLLIAGSLLNQRQHQWLDSECYVVKPGVFGGAALLSFATTVFGIIYYAAAHGRDTKQINLAMQSSLPVASVEIEPDSTKEQQSSWASAAHV